MKSFIRRTWISVLLFMFFAGLQAASLWNGKTIRNTREFPTELQTEAGEKVQIPEYILVTEKPSFILFGKTAQLKVILEPEGSGTPVGDSSLEINTLAMESRLDLPGASMQPEGLITAPLSVERTTAFFWNLHPETNVDLTGILWIYVSATLKGSGEVVEIPVYALELQIPVHSILGMPADIIFVVSILGMLASIFLFGLKYKRWATTKKPQKRIDIIRRKK